MSALPESSPVFQALKREVLSRRCLVLAGLPGTGKSLLTQQAGFIARDAGREVSLLQWDVAREAFESPEILQRYPEIDGVTHPVIRKAAGIWARRAAGRFLAEQTPGKLLIIEAPLIGGRLMDLARPARDGAEARLACGEVMFILPVPSAEVKAALRGKRGADMAARPEGQERFNAPVHLLDAHVSDINEAAAALGFVSAAGAAYDPDVYAQVYLHALRARHCLRLDVTEIFAAPESVYARAEGAADLKPDAAETAQACAAAEAIEPGELEQEMTAWFNG